MNLVGGYYDAGDNVKFGLPMAFTVTMMAWSVIEYGNQLAANGELGHSIDAIKWGTDYFIKAHPEPNVLYGEVFLLMVTLLFILKDFPNFKFYFSQYIMDVCRLETATPTTTVGRDRKK